jgi:signal transduction histidine kinase
MRTTLLRVLYSPWVYPAALVFAAAFLIVSELSYRESITALDQTGRMAAGRLAIHRFQQQISDAESGQRGYLITGRPEFLEPYRAAVRDVDVTQREIIDYFATERPERLPLAQELSKVADDKMAELEAAVRLRSANHDQPWLAQVATRAGKAQSDRIRAISKTLIDEELRALEVKRAGIYRTLYFNRLGIGALTTLSVLGLYLVMRQASVIHDHREQQRLALQVERDALERQVDARTQELRELAQYLQSVREDEKGRLARELHDELGALLTAAKLDVARLRSRLSAAGASPELRERLDHLTTSLNDGIALKRRIIEDLRPSSLAHLGLVPALQALLDDARTRLSIELNAQLDDVALKPPADLTVYRFVQEALTNTAKYAKAKAVSVSMRVQAEHVLVQVSDDGVGFDPAASRAGQHGLTGLRYRVAAIGGRLQVSSAPGRGTTLRAELPLSVVARPPQRMAA